MIPCLRGFFFVLGLLCGLVTPLGVTRPAFSLVSTFAACFNGLFRVLGFAIRAGRTWDGMALRARDMGMASDCCGPDCMGITDGTGRDFYRAERLAILLVCPASPAVWSLRGNSSLTFRIRLSRGTLVRVDSFMDTLLVERMLR